MTIEYLCDHIHLAETVAGWAYNAFIKDLRPGITPENMVSGMKKCSKTDFPVRFVALEDSECLGTVSFTNDDLPGSPYFPWLGTLFVNPEHRKKQVGERLVEHVKQFAKAQGHEYLYLRTEQASEYYKRLGWELVETTKDNFNLDTQVFRFPLK